MKHMVNNKGAQLEKNNEKDDRPYTASFSVECDVNREGPREQSIQAMVTPKGTSYLTTDGGYSQEVTKLSSRVQSSQSLLGLAGLEGHEESEDEISTADMSAVTEEQEVIDIMMSPSTPKSPPICRGFEDASYNTTPPGSVQGSGILSFSPPRLTTYSAGSVTSASITDNFVLQPRHVQSHHRQNQTMHESPRFSRSPQVQQPQLQPRSRPPRAPQHPTITPGGSNNVGFGPIVMSRAAAGTGPDLSLISGAGSSGGGHTRTPTDATNYTFLSSLTEMSGGDYNVPRRRTLSWDNNGYPGRGASAMDSKSLRGPSTSGSILQPILLPEDIDSVARPPTSISASNLRKASTTVSGSKTTAPTPPSLSRNTASTLLLAPSSLPSRDKLHPLIQKLQNLSHTKNSKSMAPTSFSKDENNLHPPIQRTQDASPSKSGGMPATSATSPFMAHHQDEKKDDWSPSQRIVQQKALLDRKSSDYASFSSSRCSSTTVRLQNPTKNSPGHALGTFGRRMTSQPQIRENDDSIDDFKRTQKARFDLGDILSAARESHVETDLIEGIERSDVMNMRKKNHTNEVSLLHDWPYSFLAWGILNLIMKGFRLDDDAEVKNLLMSNESIRFFLCLGVIALIKRSLSKEFFEWQVLGHYRDDFFLLRKIWALLYEISVSSTEEEKNDCDKSTFPNVSQYIDRLMDINASSSIDGLGMTRESFIETIQDIYERLSKDNDRAELSLITLCEVTNLSDSCSDSSKVRTLSDLFYASRSGQVSKFDFVKSTDSIFKATILLIANVNNTYQICFTIEKIVNGILYTIILVFLPSIFATSIGTLMLILFTITLNVSLMIYFTSSEYLRGIIHLVTEKPYDIGDRIHFTELDDKKTQIDDGPPSGGWIVERVDLFKTTLRQGITGECMTIANGSAFLTNSSVVNWKRWHKARVTVSIELSGNITRDQIHFFRNEIIEWIEDRPREWIRLDSFRMINDKSQQQPKPNRVKYSLILCHRESWHNYAAVQDSRSDILFYLHELQKGMEA